MADIEKVIKGLHYCTKLYLGCKECPYFGESDGKASCECKLKTDALELLKEQEAKQVIRKQCKKEHDDGSIDYFAEWYCPHCNSLILRGFDNPSIKFCYKCGKPVLWEGR